MKPTDKAKRRTRSGCHLVPGNEAIQVVHLFEERSDEKQFTEPFLVLTDISGPNLGTIRVEATIDDGGLLCAVDTSVWALWKETLGPVRESRLACVMGNGTVEKSQGTLSLHVNVHGCATVIEVEILNSGGSFKLLLGKPWLGRTKATHEYTTDSVSFELPAGSLTIKNEHRTLRRQQLLLAKQSVPPLTSSAQTTPREPLNEESGAEDRTDEFFDALEYQTTMVDTTPEINNDTETPSLLSINFRSSSFGGIEDVDREPNLMATHRLVNQLRHPDSKDSLFAPDRIKFIQDSVVLGDQLSSSEHSRVMNLLAKFADIFALKLSEVKPIDFMEHKIGVKDDAKLPKSAHSRPLTSQQREWLHEQVHKLVEAGILVQMSYKDVRCVSSVVLAPKPNHSQTRSLEELRILVNAACAKAGVPLPHPDSPSDPSLVKDLPESLKKVAWRLCHNFGPVNDETPTPPFPIGDLSRRQNAMAGFKLYNILDLAMGYHACMISREDWGLTAFEVEDLGHFAYIRMPFGLTGSPATFCEMMVKVFGDMIGHDMENYIDDICQGGHSFEDLFTKFRKILVRCRESGISLAPSKVILFSEKVLWAGVELSADGLSPDLSKVAAIVEWPRPKTAHETLSFLSTVSHFRTSMPRFAMEADPLYEMVRGIEVSRGKGKKKRGAYKAALIGENLEAKWGPRQDRSFARLKALITSAPVLVPIVNDRPVIVGTDASKEGLAAYLAQERVETGPDGIVRSSLHPVAFASRRNATPERVQHSFELELKGIKWAFDKFHKYIWGHPIILKTDCQAVKDLLSNRALSPTHARYKESVLGYDIIDFIHQEGKTNPADGLSRSGLTPGPPAAQSVEPGWESRLGIANDLYLVSRRQLTLLQPDVTGSALLQRFSGDATREPILDWLLKLSLPEDSTTRERESLKRKANEYFVEGGKLFRLRKGMSHAVECLTREEGHQTTLRVHKEIGHWARDILMLELRVKYDWPQLRQDTIDVPSRCPNCQQFGPRLLNFLLQPILRLQPFDMIAADYLKLPKGTGGFCEALILVDFFTRYVWGFMIKRAGSGKVSADALRTICLGWKAPRRLLTDGGSHFKGAEMDALCTEFGIEREVTPAYSAHCNGLIENENRQVLSILGKECASEQPGTTPNITSSWPKKFPCTLCLINERKTPVLNTSPKAVMFGTTDGSVDIDNLIDLDFDLGTRFAFLEAERDGTREHQRKVQEKRKEWFDKRARPVVFAPGDLVFVHNSKLDTSHESKHKLSAPWLGPLVVHARSNDANSYYLKSLSGRHAAGKVHSRRLKRYRLGVESQDGADGDEMTLVREEELLASLAEPEDSSMEETFADPEPVLPDAPRLEPEPAPSTGNDDSASESLDEDVHIIFDGDASDNEDLYVPMAQRLEPRRAASNNAYITTRSKRHT